MLQLLFCVSLFILSVAQCHAQINSDKPPFSLTLEQLEQWTVDSDLADSRNISKVPVAARFIAPLRENMDKNVKVLIAPDGMNNFANYLTPQNKFNHYTFTNWSHVDVLNWFAGTATQTINIPARPWVEAAHKNGVKVIGSVFLAIAQYGGSADTAARLIRRDENGNFPAARKLIEIAQFYKFDGWLMNQETNLTIVKDLNNEVVRGRLDRTRAKFLAKEIKAFMAYLTSIAPENMEIHWYDSMLIDGSVKWQNELNKNNAIFLQDIDANPSRTSDALFVNYWWDRSMLEASSNYAKRLGRSRYDVFFGVDLWPERKAQSMFIESQWIHDIFSGPNGKAMSSIALFANNVNFNFSGNNKLPKLSDFRTNKLDYKRFYAAQRRFFAGDDLNLYKDDPPKSWPGVGRYVPAKSTLAALPFSTDFNTGHGLVRATKGNVIPQEWHDMSEQDVLPTWQFAVAGSSNVNVRFDFENPYHGGSSLAIFADLNRDSSEIPLYQSSFILSEDSQLSFVTQSTLAKNSAFIWIETTDGNKHEFAIPESADNWQTTRVSLYNLADETVVRFGVNLSASNHRSGHIYLGQIGFQ